MPKGEYLQYGGLAILEGVMMRSPRFFSMACRAPNGEIISKTEAIEATWIGRQKWLKKPFLRGTFLLIDSMVIGNRAMRFASSVQMDPKYAKKSESDAPSDSHDTDPAATVSSKGIGAKIEVFAERNPQVFVIIAVALGLGLGFLLFHALPTALSETAKYRGVKNPTVINYIEEVIKVTFFVGYVWAISFMPEVRELFRYHGAEHKAINALEADQPIDVQHCDAQTRLHPRCGTSFAIIVLILGFLIFPLIPRYPLGHATTYIFDVLMRIGVELIALPFIVGISYELLRMAGRLRNEKWVMLAFKPGLWTQLITTKEPEEKHIEVAILALKNVLDAEEAGAVVAQPT